jgi:hypothetical protein
MINIKKLLSRWKNMQSLKYWKRKRSDYTKSIPQYKPDKGREKEFNWSMIQIQMMKLVMMNDLTNSYIFIKLTYQ